MGEADHRVLGEVEPVLGDVGEALVLGQAERGPPAAGFGGPDQAAGQVPHERVVDEVLRELPLRPAPLVDHGAFEAPHLVGGDGAELLLQLGEALVGGGGEFGVVLGAGLGEGLARLAVLVGDEGLELLVEADLEPARPVVQDQARRVVEPEIGHQPVGELLGRQVQAARDRLDLLGGLLLERPELHLLRDAVDGAQRLLRADRAEHFEAGGGPLVLVLSGPFPDERGQAADGRVVGEVRELGERPAVLGRRAHRDPLLEQGQ